MDKVHHIPTQKLIHLNKCRMYLRTITLAYMFEISGSNIKQDILHHQPKKSKLVWHTTQQPGAQMWTTWNWAINKYILNTQHKQKTTLGKWITTTNHAIPKNACQ